VEQNKLKAVWLAGVLQARGVLRVEFGFWARALTEWVSGEKQTQKDFVQDD
jgi:hypothetical protein